ncbi:hypothetical protein IEQ34_003594 [Dendrobium chrysotoxum]|uniref:LOB domain-containing protein n=1 Tax=Dendrobium chrysotoxum TaxID=161865 RepID=A0AAV7HJ22_DENCH|nr:hypothetical protein IEQ34_003594 [Dendrobium chrysotoxum]
MSSLISHPKANHIPTHPSPSSASSACAACKYQRRRCTPDCTLAPHFPANNPRQFLNVHRLFGVSNILKILKTVDPHLHKEAMASIIFQSNARARDPVGGCYGIILELQHQHELLASELQYVVNQIATYRAQIENAANMIGSDEAIYAPPAAVVDAYENMAIMQQQQAQQQHQQQYCNYFFYDAQDEQEPHQNINVNENTINMLSNEAEFDMSMNLLGNDMLEMDMIGSRQDFGQEEEVKPLLDIFDMRNTFEDDEDSMDVTAGSSITAVHCSSNTEQKDDQSPIAQLQEHELKCAASYFTLQNCNNSVV